MMPEVLSTAEPLYLEYLFAFTLVAAACFAGSYRATAIASTQEGLPLSLQTCFGADPID